MKTDFKLRTRLLTLLMLGSTSLMITACGGGDWTPEEQSDNPAAQVPVPAMKSPPLDQRNTYLAAPAATDEIKDGFNPSLWNDHAWYDCNCGRNPDTSTKAVPWTSSN